MRVNVFLFSYLREAAGRSRLEVSLPETATAADAVAAAARVAGLDAGMLARVCPAVNQEYCSPEHRLAEGDEVALIPPVSGG